MTLPREDEGDSQPNGERGAGGGTGDRTGANVRAWWLVLVEVATVIAVPSALLYALGVLAFWLRLANEYDSVGLGTTWYAASLVPRGTAAASGMEAVALGIAYGAAAGVLTLFAVYVYLYARARRGGSGVRVGLLSAPLLVPMALLVFALAWALLRLFLSEGHAYGLLFMLRFVIGTILFLGLFLTYPLTLGYESDRRSLRFAFGFYPRPAYWGIAALSILGMVVAVLWPREASLPCLWKEDPEGEVSEANLPGTQGETDPLQWTLQGEFLSKSDGTWYVLTEADRLQAIPDDDSQRLVDGDFSVRYQELGTDGAPTGEPVPEEAMKPLRPYVAVKNCSRFPSQPTIISFEGATASESGTWVQERTQGE